MNYMSYGRRAVLLSLAQLPFIRSASGAYSSEGTNFLQRWFNARAGVSREILGTPGEKIEISSRIIVPAGMTVLIRSDLLGTSQAALVLGHNASLIFEGSQCINVPIVITSGKSSVFGLRYKGKKHISAIQLYGPGPYKDISIDKFIIEDANFGILRQGSKSVMKGAKISNGIFRRLEGDAIEWNVCPYDTDIIVCDIEIDGIDNRNGKPFWGIGIGFAGQHYNAAGASDGKKVRKFKIYNITGRRLSQLIHVETGAQFSIENIKGTDISSAYSISSGLEPALIACYGCYDFSISNIRGDSHILLQAGVINSKYIEANKNFTISDIDLDYGSFIADIGGRVDSFLKIRGLNLKSGSLVLRGRIGIIDIEDIHVISSNSKKEPLIMIPDYFKNEEAIAKAASVRYLHSNMLLRRGL